MMVTEEIDALRSIGIAPQELLVLPKMIALVVALPLLTVYADVMGLIGRHRDVAFAARPQCAQLRRSVGRSGVGDIVPERLGKAPVFRGFDRVVGCFQGFQVSGSAEGVGRQTTISVVQSIFLVIVIDAAFSIAFNHSVSEEMVDQQSTATLVAVRGVEMQFGDKRVLEGVDLDVARGQILAIVGGSGSGKSTLLRLMAMLSRPTVGLHPVIRYRGTTLDRRCRALARLRKRIGVMFQNGGLFGGHERTGECRCATPGHTRG
jgi:ABC-type multidrug transport system fused ATPase/permease subunit